MNDISENLQKIAKLEETIKNLREGLTVEVPPGQGQQAAQPAQAGAQQAAPGGDDVVGKFTEAMKGALEQALNGALEKINGKFDEVLKAVQGGAKQEGGDQQGGDSGGNDQGNNDQNNSGNSGGGDQKAAGTGDNGGGNNAGGNQQQESFNTIYNKAKLN